MSKDGVDLGNGVWCEVVHCPMRNKSGYCTRPMNFMRINASGICEIEYSRSWKVKKNE